MKLLHVIHSVDPSGGGPVEVVKQLGLSHAKMGHASGVASLDAPDGHGVKNFPLPLTTLRTTRTRRGDYGFAPSLNSWLLRTLPEHDAVFVHGLWQFHSIAVQRAARVTGTPYFLFPHGMLDPWFRRRYPLKHLKKWFYWNLAERRVLRDAAAVLFTSDEERRLAHRDFPFDDSRDRTLCLGIAAPPPDLENRRRIFFEKYPSLAGNPFVLFLGRLHEKKGCDLLLKAFSGRPGIQLVVAGPCADPEYLRLLKSLVGHEGAVTFTGALDEDLKWGALRAAEVFILPSHQENFGVAVAESLACGTPVLISDKVNIWREVEAACAGLIECDDLAGTSRLLDRWISLPSQNRAAMRKAARACYVEHFEIRRMAEQSLDLIHRVTSR
jgi:glycosyltransferase involved in cell wall biosynthesis